MKTYKTITLKQIIVLLAIIFVSYGCGRSQEEIASSQLQNRNGIYYRMGSETPYTGRVVVKYSNGHKWEESTYKDGMLNGPYTKWRENGQKSSEWTYKDGKVEGTVTEWDNNGNIRK